MSATMARQGGRVQMEQSDMRLALNMAMMAKEGFLCAAIEETKYLIKKPCAEVREEKKRGVEFPGNKKVMAAIERHPAMLRQYHTSGCLPCHNGTTNNLQPHWRCKEIGAPPPHWHRQPTPKPTPALPSMPPTLTSNNSGAQQSKIVHLPAGYMYSHTAVPCAESFNVDASAQNRQHDTDVDPDMLTDAGTSTG